VRQMALLQQLSWQYGVEISTMEVCRTRSLRVPRSKAMSTAGVSPPFLMLWLEQRPTGMRSWAVIFSFV
jgi:hypothetical protein